MRTRAVLLALVAGLMLVGCGSEAGEPEASEPSETAAPAGPALPDGWRWEGFAGVLVGVPGDWGWGNSSMRLGQWCIGSPPFAPMVGRPGASTAVGCFQKIDGVDPSTLVSHTGEVVAFEWAFDDVDLAPEGDQESVRLGDVVVRVNGPADLREQILATVHRAEVDDNGCPMHLPAGFAPGDEPEPARDLATLTGVTSLSACRYPVPLDPSDPEVAKQPMPLFSSLRLTDNEASGTVAALAAAPLGGGPDNPEDCAPDFAYGDEMQVLLIDSDEGRSVVHVYFSGCDHNGIDDGVALRALTREAIQPLIADANAVFGWSGRKAKSVILEP